MARAYDSSGKFLINEFPTDWLALLGMATAGPVHLINANLSTITAEADKVIRVGDAEPSLIHFELQAGRDTRLATRLFRYNALLDDRHNLPTRSVAVLLRPEADGPELVGQYRRNPPGLPDYLNFRYDVVRVWREPVATFLDGGLGTVPLAPVSDLAGRSINEVVRLVNERLGEAPPDRNQLLWVATRILMGLRYSADQVQFLLRGVRQMKESSVYQAILAEGRAEGEARGKIEGAVSQSRRFIIRHGERRFGAMTAADRARVEAVDQLDRLEDWEDRIDIAPVATWAEFWALVGPE